jgi:hypothetical protein
MGTRAGPCSSLRGLRGCACGGTRAAGLFRPDTHSRGAAGAGTKARGPVSGGQRRRTAAHKGNPVVLKGLACVAAAVAHTTVSQGRAARTLNPGIHQHPHNDNNTQTRRRRRCTRAQPRAPPGRGWRRLPTALNAMVGANHEHTGCESAPWLQLIGPQCLLMRAIQWHGSSALIA